MLPTVSSRVFRPLICHRTIAYDYRAISDGQKATSRRRTPARGGQNLSERYVRLEKSLRQKEALSSELEQIQPSTSQSATQTAGELKPHQKPLQFFHGFQIPEKPKPPADDECCMSGCAVCVYDLYEESLEAYEKAVASLQTSLYALDIPEYEWPPSIQPKYFSSNQSSTTDSGRRKDTVMSAFEEMERSLALKRQAQAEADSGSGSSKVIEQRRVDSDANAAASAESRIAKRNRLMESMKEAPRDTFLQQVYQGVRWVLFSSR